MSCECDPNLVDYVCGDGHGTENEDIKERGGKKCDLVLIHKWVIDGESTNSICQLLYPIMVNVAAWLRLRSREC